MTRRLLAATVAVLALAACSRSSGSGPDAAPSSTTEPPVTSSPTASASATATASATPSASPTSTGTMTAAVYYVGKSSDARLFREFRRVPRSTATVRAAVDAMLHTAPLDPDYRSYWPTGTTVNGISVSGSVVTIDLSSSARNHTATTTVERQSLQQLVYTVTAASPSTTGVRLRFDGATKPTLWGHVSTSGTLTRAVSNDTVAAVWVESPAQRSAVGHSLNVTGSAAVFEATVSWSLRRIGGGEIASGSTMASTGAPGRGTWTVTVAIPASVTGDVVFTAWEASAENGQVTSPDDKRFRVS